MADKALDDLGFADFVAVMLVETLDAIVASHTSQATRLRALDAAAGLTPEEFAATGITADVLGAMLAQLFPNGNGGTSIVPGGPVPPPDDLAEVGIHLGSGDVDGTALRDTGVQTIRHGVALFLARRQLEAMRDATSRGIPRVYVDGGTLRATLNFTAVAAQDGTPPAAQPAVRLRVPTPDSLHAIAGSRIQGTVASFDSPLLPGVLDSIRTTRLRVTNLGGTAAPVGGTTTGSGGTGGTAGGSGGTGGTGNPTRTEVHGDIEIRFRTEL